MTLSERASALLPLGFTERQARFLTVAALHGGYFLRRQYMVFCRIAHGQPVTDFLDGLVSRGYGTTVPCRPGRGAVYHVHAKPLYAALGEENNRNRKRATAAQIARKLMLLDYVLSQPSLEWVATEADKVALFRDRLGIAEAHLPHRDYRAVRPPGPTTTRYFVEKLPIGIDPSSLSIRFVYLVTDTSGAGLQSFLRDHAPLLASLPNWDLVAASPRHIPGLRAAEATYRRCAADGVALAPEDVALTAYFRARRHVEAGELNALTVAEITNYRVARAKYGDARYDAAYAEWCRSGSTASVADAKPTTLRGTFLMHTLPFTYDNFGSLAGLC